MLLNYSILVQIFIYELIKCSAKYILYLTYVGVSETSYVSYVKYWLVHENTSNSLGLCYAANGSAMPCFHSVVLGVVTLGTVLSSVSSGKVKPSDPISKILCKNYKQVSQSGETHVNTNTRLFIPWSHLAALVPSGAPDRPLGEAVPNPSNRQLCPGGSWSHPV